MDIIMKKIEFGTCMGEKIVNPSFQKLESLIKTGGSGYWSVGAGQSRIKYEDENTSQELYLMMAEGYGFYLEFYKDKTYYVTVSSSLFDDVAEIFVGGDPIPVPRALFLNEEDTIIQIKEFLNTGDVSYNFNWVDKGNVNWHYGEDPNAKEYEESSYKDIREYLVKNRKVKRKWMKELESNK